MSFSSSVKNDLCRLDVQEHCCRTAELAAALAVIGTASVEGSGEIRLKMTTENSAFARRVYSLIKKLYGVLPEIAIRRSRKLKKHVSYILVIPYSLGTGKLLSDIRFSPELSSGEEGAAGLQIDIRHVCRKPCCKKAFLRGAFLAGGSISDPEKTYHLEIAVHNEKTAAEVSALLNHFKLNAKMIRRKGSHVVYLKEGENIVDFLNIIGAHSALMELENVRILKGMRNNVNRIVNCETANLEKTVNASLRQVENIQYIKENLGFAKLPENLREIAEIRLAYSEANLVELGQLLTPPLGKSGVNHRLRKLDTIAENLKRMRGEM